MPGTRYQVPKVAICDSGRQAGLGGFGFFGFGGLFGVLSPMWHLLAGSIEPSRDRVPLATRGAPLRSQRLAVDEAVEHDPARSQRPVRAGTE